MRNLLFIILTTLSFGQKLDEMDMALNELETIVQMASRSSQRVFVEDFTGLQ
tara:strand:+ start:31 stop:186 length:156 start_codon:yes stop_codon:yes gene_type:complete